MGSNINVFHQNARTAVVPRRAMGPTSTALTRGYAVCYDEDKTVTAGNEIQRRNFVEEPAIGNVGAFAGVLAYDYPSDEGRKTVEFYEPGAECEIYVDGAYAAGDLVSFKVDSVGSSTGQFGAYNGVPGRGSARLLQATTEAGYALAVLLDGPESGGTHYCQVASGAALSTTVIGLTQIKGDVTIGSAATYTLPSPSDPGVFKAFHLLSGLTTENFDITFTSAVGQSGLSLVALASAELDAADDFVSVRAVGPVDGVRWKLEENNGPTLA